jgi:hypothetical protein
MYKEIKLKIKGKQDLMLMIIALNTLQCLSRNDLVKNETKSEKIEQQWLREAVEEFDRIMTIKTQLLLELEK